LTHFLTQLPVDQIPDYCDPNSEFRCYSKHLALCFSQLSAHRIFWTKGALILGELLV